MILNLLVNVLKYKNIQRWDKEFDISDLMRITKKRDEIINLQVIQLPSICHLFDVWLLRKMMFVITNVSKLRNIVAV